MSQDEKRKLTGGRICMNILRTKSIEQSIKDTEEPEFQLRKELGPLDLIVFGIGVIVGTGIFVLTGVAAATRAGPAIALSFVVSGIACALAALCYEEKKISEEEVAEASQKPRRAG
jgi:APA family basic amino acid/polyamine antiporter